MSECIVNAIHHSLRPDFDTDTTVIRLTCSKQTVSQERSIMRKSVIHRIGVKKLGIYVGVVVNSLLAIEQEARMMYKDN